MSPSDPIQASIQEFQEGYDKLKSGLGEIIVGQQSVQDELLWAIFAGGHVLLEGIPGLGKTLMVRSLGALMGGQFSRLQFTPDLMPTDITGSEILHRSDDGQVEFEIRTGPVFANVILADEINRATPRTQAGLLEAMEEGSVTIGRKTLPLPDPFFVVATQNPLDLEGTYPLPEAQLDRFLLQSRIQMPDESQMVAIFDRHGGPAHAMPQAVLQPDGLLRLIELAKELPVADALKRYAARLVAATRPENESSFKSAAKLRQGASPRAMLALLRCGRIRALADGRTHLDFEDVRAVLPAVFRHRLRLRYESEAEGGTVERVLDQLLEEVPTDA